MGRSLRSGKQISSLSPPNKRGGGKDDGKGKEARSAAAAASRAKSSRAKGGGVVNNILGKKHTLKGKKKSNPEPSDESTDSDDDMDEMIGQNNNTDNSSEDDSNNNDRATLSSNTKTPKRSNTKIQQEEDEDSEGEEDDDSDDESDDDVKMVAPTPLRRSSQSASKKENVEESSDENSDEGDGSDDDDDKDDDDNDDDKDDDDNYIASRKKDKGFTDENANWLKPKQPKKMTLMSSDEEGDDDDDDKFEAKSGSDDDDDDDDMLEVERQSRLIDSEMKLENEEAEEELRRTIAQEMSVFHLPTPEELMDDENRVVPPSELRSRIEDILEVLADFKTRREVGRSRSEYIDRLGKDMAELFGYLQELVDYFLSMFGPNECLEFLEASDKSRPLVVRVNTLKARRKDLAAALMKRGVRLDPLAPWSKVGLKIYESTVPIGATPEYLAGHYMLQSAASMCPVMALGPQPGDRVLDMSSAPGGKTSYISQLMRNKGVVIANDLKPERQKATVANLHRLGVRNVVTCCYDGRKIGVQMRNSFDRILLDAPCSGLGVISRDPSVKVQRTMPEVLRCAHLQKELLVAAIDALNHKSKKGGGFMVYSTCSVAVAENEEVVNYLLSKRDVRLVDPGLDFGKPGFTRYEHKRFHPSVALTRRFYPHVHNMDGFYVAKIQKLSDKRKGEEEKKEQLDERVMDEAVKDDTLNVVVSEVGKQHQQVGKMKEKKNNKRGKSSKVYDEDGCDEMTSQRKKLKVSYAPSNVQLQKSQNKVKKNAKISKPRRMKITGM